MGDEDCLNLNVYTPKIDSKKKKMEGGASFSCGPDCLLEQNVVTFNH